MMTRRGFLFGAAVMAMAPVNADAAYARPFTVHDAAFQTLATVLDDLFPAGHGVPSVPLLHTLDYFAGVLADPCIPEDEKRFVRSGARWLDERARETFGKAYGRLGSIERRAVLDDISARAWGENWILTLFSYLFESLLGDPVYGANTREAGWRWLGHVPGYPRPPEPFTETVVWKNC
jgi:hypothetical protein